MLCAMIGLRNALLASAFIISQVRAQVVSPASTTVAAHSRFAFKAFHSLTSDTADKNVLLAPAGLSLTFALLANVASAEVRSEIENTFELSGLDLQQINQGSLAIRKELRVADESNLQTKPAGMTMKNWQTLRKAPPNGLLIADSLWARNWRFPPAFLRVNQEYYGAEPLSLLPSSTVSAQISRWAQMRIGKNMPIQIGPLKDNTFIIVNVTHFHTSWLDPFAETLTRPGPFKLLSGSMKQVNLMYKSRQFRYLETSKFQAVILPYADQTDMYVLLPAADSSLTELEQSLDADNWSAWRAQFTSRMGRVGLPRFAFEAGFDVKARLERLGMSKTFNNPHAFPVLNPARTGGAWLTAALQTTSLKVDERGTKATSVGVLAGVVGGIHGGYNGPPPPPPFEMIVNRPFFFAISDRPSGEILFMGAVVDP